MLKKTKAPSKVSITSHWKKFIALGCSHGYLIDPLAKKAVLSFIDEFQPDTRIHLGDFIDTAAFRSGANGTNDEYADIDHDLMEGLLFLQEMRATMVLCGNHERRLWKFVSHPKTIIQSLSTRLITDITTVCERLKAPLHPYTGVWQMVPFANYKLTHGYMFGENAARDHAEAHGNIIFAHTHRAAMANGRRDDDAQGICVGTLTDIPNMDYADNRRSTLGWSQGFVYGYYNDKILQPYLCVKQKTAKDWQLP